MLVADHERLLEPVAGLTEKRDRESLEPRLRQTISASASVQGDALPLIQSSSTV